MNTMLTTTTTTIADATVTAATIIENQVELVGEVFANHRNRKHNERGLPIARTGDTAQSAAMQRLRLQIMELNGTLSTIPIAVTRTTKNAALLLDLLNGDRVRVTGLLTHEDTYDGRFISPEMPQGRPTREIRVRVTSLARAEATDLDGSFVQLQGEITEPPAVRGHPTLTNLRVVRCKLRVVSRIPDGRGGELVERHVLPVDVPIDLRNVEAAMVRGNVIAVQGVLDVLMTEIARDEVIEQRLIEVREDWSARSAELEPDARTQAGREVARTLRTLGTERSLCLRATRVTLVSGALGELRETQRARTAHIRTLRSGGRPHYTTMRSLDSSANGTNGISESAHGATEGTQAPVVGTRRNRKRLPDSHQDQLHNAGEVMDQPAEGLAATRTAEHATLDGDTLYHDPEEPLEADREDHLSTDNL